MANDQWVINGLPINDEWGSSCGCPPSGSNNSTVDNITITGSPGAITSRQNGNAQWSLVLNDGTPAADFRIDRFDNSGALVDSPMTIVRATGVVSFNDPVMLAGDPVEPLEATTKEYVDNEIAAIGGIPEAPANGFTYGREGDTATWNVVPIEAPVDGQLYARNLRAWVSIPYPIPDAPSDGAAYARQNGAWTAAATGGPYMPLSGGIFTGVVTFPSNNSVVINGALNTPHAILGQVAGLNRWQLQMPDQTNEGAGNAGANFSLSAFSTTGGFLATWLTIARADGSATFNGSGVTIAGSLALGSPGQFALYGGTAGQFLQTNGAGVLIWATPAGGGGGLADAPNDGTAYARKSAAWAHLTHTDITDWTATLTPYALITSVPVASTTTPLMDGTAAVGTGTTFARADHVHPTDTSRASVAYVDAKPVALGDNRIINGNFAVNQRGQVSGTALAAAAYGHDRWKAGASGCTYTFTAALPDTTITITAGSLTQIIEAGVIEGGVYTLSWTGTAQARVYQGTPTGAYAASPITTASLPAGVNTIVEFNAGTVTRVKMESGSVATPFNRQSLAKSMADCQRYFRWVPFSMYFYAAAAGQLNRTTYYFPDMRASPTISSPVVDPNLSPANANQSSFAFSNMGPYSTTLDLTSVAIGSCFLLGYRGGASAEL